MDKREFDRKIRHIPNEDLVAALKLTQPGLKGLREAIRLGDDRGACEAWRAHLARRLKQERAEKAPRRKSPDRDAVIQEADLVVARDIKCWGGVRIQYDGEIDFARNLGGSSNYGFHYFGWIHPLGAAYRLTGDEQYARAFVEIFTQWYRQRDLVRGDLKSLDVIWYELGCAARSGAFTSLYLATLGSEAARSPEYHLNMLKTLLGHGRWLHQHETTYQPGNWQVSGASALLNLGLTFPEFREADRWVRRGLKWVAEHTRRDVHPDGCHRERAPHYHLGVVGGFFRVHQMLPRKKALVPARKQIGETVERMLSWTMSMMTPSRHSPTVGDSEYDIPTEEFLRKGLVLGNRELVWASGATGRKIERVRKELGLKKAVRPRMPANPTYHRESSGFLIVRSGWGKDDLYFNLNYGPYGGGHSHAEALAFQFWANGSPLAVDCGRGISYDDPLHGPWYKSVYAHNMVVVDGASPSIEGRKGRLLFWDRKKDLEFFSLSHAGYAAQGVRHTRCVLINRAAQYVLLLDFLKAGSEDHRYEWVLNSPLTDFRISRGRAVSPSLWVGAADPETIEEVRFSKAKMALPLEGRSTWGQEREDGTNLRWVRRGGTLCFPILLLPGKGSGEVRFSMEPLLSAPSRRMEVCVETRRFQHALVLDAVKGVVRWI